MVYPFSVYRAYTGDNFFWVAKSTVLEGVIGQGKTAKKAIRELKGNEKAWIDFAKENPGTIPIPNVPVVSIDDKSILEVLPKI